MRWLLVVDTCGAVGGIAVADLARAPGEEIVSERALPGRETQERLVLAIEDVLRESGVGTPRNLDGLVVVSGPGSFTGVRIGMAAVKGLAEATAKPVITVSRLAMLAAQVSSVGTLHAWLDAGRGDVYAGIYREGTCVSEAMLHREDARSAVDEGHRVVIAETLLADAYPGAETVPTPGVREALRLAADAIRAGEFADVALMDANYLRVPDAELALRSRLGSTA